MHEIYCEIPYWNQIGFEPTHDKAIFNQPSSMIKKTTKWSVSDMVIRDISEKIATLT